MLGNGWRNTRDNTGKPQFRLWLFLFNFGLQFYLMNLLALLKYTKQNSKRLFWLILIILSGSLFTCFITLNSVWPFFAYSLYAYPEKDKEVYKSVELILNGTVFNFYKELPQPMATCIENSSNHFIFLKENKNTDPFYYKLTDRGINPPAFLDPVFKHPELSDLEFTTWLKKYIEFNSDQSIKSIQINEVSIQYLPKAKITARRTILTRSF